MLRQCVAAGTVIRKCFILWRNFAQYGEYNLSSELRWRVYIHESEKGNHCADFAVGVGREHDIRRFRRTEGPGHR
ncbi:hypothetical protein D3C84_1171470 [compost metagenome]